MTIRHHNARRSRRKSSRKSIELKNTFRQQSDKFIQEAEKKEEKQDVRQ
jgi:hypothetical protein